MQHLLNTITAGDMRALLPTLPDKSVRMGFADPPYWVDYKYGEGRKDSDMDFVEPGWLVSELCRVSEVAFVTPGHQHFYDYPRPTWIAAWFKFGSTGRNGLGGFNVWEPVLVYGKPPRMWQDAINLPSAPNLIRGKSFHTCPKPEKLLGWLIGAATEPGEVVLDPCVGSGTTCVEAKRLRRQYMGFEIDQATAALALARVDVVQPMNLVMLEAAQVGMDLEEVS